MRWTMRGAFLAAAVAAGVVPAAHALEVQQLDVAFRDGRYVVEFQASLDAPAEAVGAVLTDFDNYPQLDERILESRLDSGGAQLRLVTRLRGCIGAMLCRSMRRVEVLDQASGELIATAIPEESDVRYGRTHSRWSASGEATNVSYTLEIVPDFWVPPIIGRRAMIRTLRDGTLALFRNVERVAGEKVPPGTR
jgi:hypothetical protein